jgi:hypothetical protein
MYKGDGDNTFYLSLIVKKSEHHGERVAKGRCRCDVLGMSASWGVRGVDEPRRWQAWYN